MKKSILFSGTAIAAILVAVVLSAFAPHSGKGDQDVAKPIPDNVMAIFQNSCAKCHTQGGSGAALANVNFTKWESYDSAKQAKKATAICKTIQAGKMPPKSFINKNPNAVLTDAQKTIICSWAK
ncbi:MAG: hypothetical protein CVT93_10370 [Bacteroidetes bacterium HGW-Bacteroidetes-10]|nr:MAG: hypothetical protein CVT93_10370 [Bacteroidetes bacterium HGW-Bacteroidetes-10]